MITIFIVRIYRSKVVFCIEPNVYSLICVGIMNLFRYFSIHCEILAYLGLTSSLVDEKQTLGRKIMQKIFMIIVFGLYLSTTVLSSYQRLEEGEGIITLSHTVIDFIETSTELSFVIASLLSPISRRKNWSRFFRLMRSLHNFNDHKIRVNVSAVQIPMVYLLIFLMVIFDMIWFFRPDGYNWYSITLAMHKLYYTCFVCIIYITNKSIKNFIIRFINNLKEIVNNEMEVRKVELLRKPHLIAQKLIEEFNVIFGWQIFFQMMTSVMIILNLVNDIPYVEITEDTLWTPQIFSEILAAVVSVVSTPIQICIVIVVEPERGFRVI